MTFDLFGDVPQPGLHVSYDVHFSDDMRLRWHFGATWGQGPRALWIGHNPSLAGSNPKNMNDPTTGRIQKFSMAWQYCGYDLGNFYPVVSPDPQFARNWAPRHPNEMAANREILMSMIVKASAVVACWGAINQDDAAIAEIIEFATRYHDIICLGTNDNGSPRHPMARGSWRVPDDQQPVLFRAKVNHD